jgi:anhydro-N-acetylmuramic acid kinase
MSLYIGLMSGTSMDSIDAALLEIEPQRASGQAPQDARARMQLRVALARDWPQDLQRRLRHAAEHPDQVGLEELGRLDIAVGAYFAQAAQDLLQQAALPVSAIQAIGSHGQTLLHVPRGSEPFTLQVGDPNVIAERLGIDVVADFRRRDVAAGGEGAPLMPAFHAAAFGAAGELRAVINIGGIANLTLLRADGSVLGFDTGPGNCWLDAWARRHLGQPHDAGGRWGASGRVDQALLARLLRHPYFERRPPKSTGRETFTDAWLDEALAAHPIAPVDVQATLCELTARTIADGLVVAAESPPREVLVCGGGAFNADLMARLGRALTDSRLDSTARYGIAPEHVEAAGFAWLAHCCLQGLPGNLPSVTGARHLVPLGAIYRGRLA